MRRFSLFFLVAACSSSAAQSAPPAAAAKKYQIAVDAPKAVKTGAKDSFKIVLTPAPGFHVNQEFPVEVSIDAADVKLGKQKLAKSDAKVWSEREGRFEVDFQIDQAGERSFQARARFAVCTEKDCWPARETLTWKITAHP